MKKLSILLILLMAVGLVAAGCGGGGEEEAEGTDEALVLNVGSDAAYAPFEYKGDGDEVEGFDADLIKAIGEAVGIEVNVKHVDWDGLFPALESGDINAIISAMTITEERKEIVNFSDPYFESIQTIAVREDSKIADLDDLVGIPVGVQQNTTGQFAMEELEGVNLDDIKKYPTTPDALMNLENGLVEAVVADAPVVKKYIDTNPDCGLKMIDSDKFEPEFYGIAMSKEDEELLAKVNEGLKIIKENGTYDEIYSKYFSE